MKRPPGLRFAVLAAICADGLADAPITASGATPPGIGYILCDDLGCTDIAKKRNVEADHPEVVARLTLLLERSVADGRSTPREPQKNDVAIQLWKDQPAKVPANKRQGV